MTRQIKPDSVILGSVRLIECHLSTWFLTRVLSLVDRAWCSKPEFCVSKFDFDLFHPITFGSFCTSHYCDHLCVFYAFLIPLIFKVCILIYFGRYNYYPNLFYQQIQLQNNKLTPTVTNDNDNHKRH